MKIRNSAKAIIIKDNHILTVQKVDDDGPWYLLPGGGQNHNETLIEACKRECLEELGANVEVGEIKLIREYIGKNHEFASTDSNFHQVEFYFVCRLISDIDEKLATCPDIGQTGLKWIPMDKHESFKVYPKFLLNAIREQSELIYYGDKN
jgi:ADP-ribose pyrophosphatase YjhB (NUDIX family)